MLCTPFYFHIWAGGAHRAGFGMGTAGLQPSHVMGMGLCTWEDAPGPGDTYWIFLVKFLETMPPSTCCSSCLPGGEDKGVSPLHWAQGLTQQAKQTNPRNTSKRDVFPSLCGCLPREEEYTTSNKEQH